ncbi:MAG: TonB-dependent receptor, partial [Bacteroidales bacterium]
CLKYLLPAILFMAQTPALFSSTQQTIELQDSTRKLSAAKISAIRIEKSIAITKTEIDSVLLSQSVNNSLAGLLSKETPVFVKSYGMGSMATVSFRGTAPSHTQVKWNGLKINNPMLGQVDFSQLPIWMIDKAKILHGGSSLVEGSGALGGSVHLYSTVHAKQQKPKLSLVQRFASFGNLGTMVSAKAGNSHIAGEVRYIYEEAGNNFKFNNNAVLPNRTDIQRNAQYTRTGVSANLVFKVAETDKVTQSFWHLASGRNLPTIMSYEGKGREEHQKDAETRYSAVWNRVRSRYRHSLTSGFSYNRMDYFLANKTDLGQFTNIDSRSKAGSFQNSYNMQYTLSNNFILKADASLNFYSVKTLNHITKEGYKATRSESGASASLYYKGASRLNGYFLIREELTDGKFTPLMPSLGIEYQLTKWAAVKLNATRNYHLPTLNDLYWLPGGNPNLKPERGYTGDLSFEIKSTNDTTNTSWHTVVTGYLSHINDWIIWRPGEFRYWSATNLKEVFVRGAEFNISASHECLGALDGLKVKTRANWAITHTTNQKPMDSSSKSANTTDNSKGKQLIYIPVHKGNLFLSLNYSGYSLNWHSAYTGERFTTSSNEKTRHSLPSYWLHNLSLKKELTFLTKKITALIEVENLFNTQYQAILWRAMPGTNYSFTLRLDI